MKESDLYLPLKSYLEGQGYESKAEIGACDIMAIRGDEAPVIVEMKTSFSLALVMQGIERQRLFDCVYLAVPAPPKKGWGQRYKDITALCRRLGLGLLVVDPVKGRVEAHLDPGAMLPARQLARAGKLLREFQRRVGDPNIGGTTGVKRMTAYRQDAIAVARALEAAGEAAPKDLALAAGVAKAGAILRDNHYGWFEKVGRGRYVLALSGQAVVAGPAGGGTGV